MPNLITRYDNGSFEDILANWNAEFIHGNYNEAIRSEDQAFEGDASLRLKTVVTLSDHKGYQTPVRFSFPAVNGGSYEVKLRIKCDATVPDDIVFYLLPKYKIGNYGRITPITGAQAKEGWQELKVNFIADTYLLGGIESANVVLAIVNGSDLFHAAYPDFKNDFPQSIESVFANVFVPNNCLVYLDSAYSDVKVIDPQALPSSDRPNLYHVENVFLLRVGSQIYLIDEPLKWDDVQIGIEFDEVARSFKFEFTDKDILLEFDNQAGFQLLKAEYKKNGGESDASLKFGERDINGVIAIIWEGSLNFSAWDQGVYSVKMNAERRSFGEKLRTYFDTKTNIYTDRSLGGGALTPLVKDEIYMHPRQLTYAAEFRFNYTYAKSLYDLWENAEVYDLDERVRGENGLVYESLADDNSGHEPSVSPGWWKLSTSFPQDMTSEVIDGAGSDPEAKTAVPPWKAISNNIKGLSEPVPPDGPLIYIGPDDLIDEGLTKRSFSIEWRASYQVDLGNNSQNPYVGFSVWKKKNVSLGGAVFIPFDNPSAVAEDEQVTVQGMEGNVEHVEVFLGFASGILDVYPDEGLFVKAYVYVTDNTSFNVSNFKWTDYASHYLIVRETTVYQPSLIRANRIHEIVNRQLETTTDKPNPLKSNFFGRIDLGYAANGCAANHYAFNGLMLRGMLDKSFLLSGKDWYTALSNLFCLGMSIERDNIGGEWVRLEPLEYFFRNVLLLKLDSVSKFRRYPAEKDWHNEIEIASSKYPQDNQPDSLEDFFAKIWYSTPLTKIKNKLNIAITWILSPYYIEYTRRQGFAINPTNSYETDNDTFVLSGTEPSMELATNVSITWVGADSKMTINKVVPVVEGDVITVSGGASNNGQYTVLSLEIPFSFDKIILIVAEGVTDATTTSTINNGTVRAYAKRDEDFESVNGVTFEHSVYNLEHHFKRILLRWAKVFQSGWSMFVSAATANKQVKFIEGVANKEVGTRLKSSIGCKYGDSLRLSRYDRGSETITKMDKPLFGKDYFEFETPMSWATFQYIGTAYEARNVDDKNYGYLQLPDSDNELVDGFPVKLKFSPSKQVCKMILREKYKG